jgi:hypothetical protein
LKSAPPVRRAVLTPASPPPIRRETIARKAPPKSDRPRSISAPSRSASVLPPSQLLEVVPVDMPTERPRQVLGFPSTKLPEVAPAEPPAEEPPPPAVKVSSRPMPALLAQLMPLLRSRQTMRAAFVLHEILGPPLCHQRKVRSSI